MPRHSRFLIPLAVAVACAPASTPETRPVPERAPPVPGPGPVTAPPASIVRDPLEGRSAFRYAAGTRNYEIFSEAKIELASDTAARSETVRLSALVTLTFETLSDSLLAVSGTVSEYEVLRGEAIPAPDSTLPSTATFNASITPVGRLVSLVGDTAGCNPQEPLLAVGQRAIIATPNNLDAGARWSDSVSTTVCRGGTPITTGSVRDYEVEAREMVDGVPVARVRRRETFTLAGSSSVRGRHVAIVGRGSSSAILRFDLARGLLLSEEGTSETALTVSSPRSQAEFRQREATKLSLRNP
ncbi:MAG: hypothetical protein H7Z74_17195 [Anaerolineae bacterium]|nr:hypothetical protein [Gemmatimonadaceae bacterium]